MTSTDAVFLQTYLSQDIQQHLVTFEDNYHWKVSRWSGSWRLVLHPKKLSLTVYNIGVDVSKYPPLLEGMFGCLARLDECLCRTIVIFQQHSPTEPLPSHVALNPNVGITPQPFLALQHVVIDGSTCDVQAVELFLTHTLNSVGLKYLRQHVTLSIYGRQERLPSHLLQNLRQSYGDVKEYESIEELMKNASSLPLLT
jgi:hypothetical protein